MVAPTKWNYCAYYSAPVIYGLGGRYTSAMAPYNLDPTDPTAAVTPNAMVYVIDRTANNWVPITLMVLHVEFDFIITM